MMFALPPTDPDAGDLRSLSDAIDLLCDVLDGDRGALIEGLAEIVRRRAEFEDCRLDLDHGAIRN
ncbi:hypothetical protein SAMN02799625_05415 [Methylobacterium sp. UNC300MFChir4.1]|jgi:hypothetical protein|uniref:hypothetical protein n=1 Tax=unclassified Methylobacterium TaxID=2615210 RepID=UPI0008C1B0BC|nr:MULTISPECIES: hypothetical protein [unclassified Methylobacterium]SEP30607.1 hypothetical protein SAMN02799625_05415 [Methylobacterium sp. UNC300MFChir4.1]